MKCTEISISNTYPTGNRTLEQFRDCTEAASPWGKLVFALVEENVWSLGYSFSAHIYGKEPYLLIYHPVFFRDPDDVLTFKAEGEGISLHGVGNAIRNQLLELQDRLQPGIRQSQRHANDLVEEAQQIVVRKARAAIATVFPETGELEYLPFSETWRALYVFGRSGDGFLYIARTSGHEVTRGVTRIEAGILVWSNMGDMERHKLFWTELARMYVIRELQIPESELPRHGDVSAKEKPLSSRIHRQFEDGYEVEKVTFRITDDDCAVVEFGPDNLPAKAYVASPPARVIGLVDKHMTP